MMDISEIKIDLYSYFYELVKQIPRGMVSTYGDLATALGDIIASRAVGEMLSKNPNPIVIPCHRVVKSDGTIGGFTHPNGIKKKIELLESEGIKVENNRIVGFDKIRFREFRTNYPLKKIREFENELLKKLELKDVDFDYIYSYDVSYNDRNAYIAIVKFKNYKIEDYTLIKKIVNFPYIPTYLSYREGILLLDHIPEGLGILDGNGILHPRRIGLASFLGILWDKPTLGIAKSLLFGKLIDEMIYDQKEIIGFKIKNRYVSPGNHISLRRAYKIGKEILNHIDPIRPAHNLAKKFMESELLQQSP
jgi:deoxyribonuclease V